MYYTVPTWRHIPEDSRRNSVPVRTKTSYSVDSRLAESCLAFFLTKIDRIASDGVMKITVSKISVSSPKHGSSRGVWWPGVKLTTHLHLARRLRMNGDIFLLPLYVLKARRGTVLHLRSNTGSSDSRLDLLVRCSLHLISCTVPEISWRKIILTSGGPLPCGFFRV